MKKLILMTVCILAVYGQTTAQENNKIIVKVDQINSSEGTVNVALFNSEKDFLNTPFMSKVKVAAQGELEFEFAGVPNGEYTISIYHDENGNGELDKNFIGIPNEPYGVSLEGKSMFGPPSYRDAMFILANENARLIISLD
jgi:uncharacterized protein (DUF2141 family)